MTAQRWYAVETHTHGGGSWRRQGRTHPSREHAKQWAESRGYVTRENATDGKRGGVYRIVEVAE